MLTALSWFCALVVVWPVSAVRDIARQSRPVFHLVYLKYAPTTTEAQKQKFRTDYVALKTQCQGITAISFGSGVSEAKADQGYSEVFVMEFVDQLSLDKYLGCLGGVCYNWIDGQKSAQLPGVTLAPSLGGDISKICEEADQLEASAFAIAAPPTELSAGTAYRSDMFMYDFDAVNPGDTSYPFVHTFLLRFSSNVTALEITNIKNEIIKTQTDCVGVTRLELGEAKSAEPFDQDYSLGVLVTFTTAGNRDAYIGCLGGPCYDQSGRTSYPLHSNLDLESICLGNDKTKHTYMGMLAELTTTEQPPNYFSTVLAFDF